MFYSTIYGYTPDKTHSHRPGVSGFQMSLNQPGAGRIVLLVRMEKSNLRTAIFAGTLWVLTLATAVAQMPGGAPGMNSSLMKLFGANSTFSAKVDVQVLDGSRAPILRMPMDFSALDGKMRADTDLGQLKSQRIPADLIAMYKQYGFDRVTSITRPDKKAIYIVYPRVQSMANMEMPKEDVASSTQPLKVEKTPQAKQTVDGHPCTKNHVVVKDVKGNVVLDATTWNAADQKDFPLQIETKEGGNISVLRFQQVNFAPPDAKLFEAPVGYKQYKNPDDLMTAIAQKSSPPAAKAGAKPAAPSTGPKPAAKPAAKSSVTNSVPRR